MLKPTCRMLYSQFFMAKLGSSPNYGWSNPDFLMNCREVPMFLASEIWTFFFMTKSPNIRWTLGMNGFFLGKAEEKWWSSPWKMADVRQKYGRKRPFCCWEKPGLPALSSRWAPGCGTEMRTTVVAGRHWGFWTCFNQWKWWVYLVETVDFWILTWFII